MRPDGLKENDMTLHFLFMEIHMLKVEQNRLIMSLSNGYLCALPMVLPSPTYNCTRSKTPFAKKTVFVCAATMAQSGFGPYHGLWPEVIKLLSPPH
jgi:hypothetical protein